MKTKMKLVITGILAAVLCLSMCACSYTKVDSEIGGNNRFVSGEAGVSACALTDTETGVQYLVVGIGYGVSVTPLLNADGTPVVQGE